MTDKAVLRDIEDDDLSLKFNEIRKENAAPLFSYAISI